MTKVYTFKKLNAPIGDLPETLRLVLFIVFIHPKKNSCCQVLLNTIFEKSKKKFTQKDDWWVKS